MHNQMHMPPRPADSGALRVKRAWEVRGDRSYQCRWPGGYPHPGMVAVRTLAGCGRIDLSDGRRLDCVSGTVAWLRPAAIRAYGCREPHWGFWWIECLEGATCALPPDAVVAVPALPGEANTLMEQVRLLDGGGPGAAVAAAGLLWLLRQWERHAAGPGGAADGGPGVMLDIMTLMRRTLSRPLPVADLARRAKLSEGRFRQVFAKAAGMAPKAYYDHLRLAQAAAWLRETDMKLADIAERLGFSSPFHLSRAFKRVHGVPPAVFRPR
jgi:AraC-like DNA-binding protein